MQYTDWKPDFLVTISSSFFAFAASPPKMAKNEAWVLYSMLLRPHSIHLHSESTASPRCSFCASESEIFSRALQVSKIHKEVLYPATNPLAHRDKLRRLPVGSS